MSDPRRLGLVLVFLALSLVKVARHEIWADEAEYWDAARASHSLAELRENTRYMGQPPLNHLVFYALSRFTRDPRAMQVLNVLEATGAVAIVAFCAPWPFAARALFAFGYFPFFEYGTISRHYALTLLLTLAFCAAWAARPRSHLTAAGLGFLLALTTFHATIVVLAFVLSLAGSWLWGRRFPGRPEALAAVALLCGVALSIAASVPPPDALFLRPWRLEWNGPSALNAAAQLWQGYAPLPPLTPPWWNRNLLEAWPAVEAVLGLTLLLLLAAALRRTRLPLLWLASSALGVALFGYFQYGGFVRHAGFFFVVAIGALWISDMPSRLLTLLLALQLPGSLYLSYKDLVEPFSPNAALAEYLERTGLVSTPVVGYEEWLAAPVFVLLDRPYYSPLTHDLQTRAEFRRLARQRSVDQIAAVAVRLHRELGQPVLLLLSEPWARAKPSLACFEDSFRPTRLCLYRIPAAVP